MITRVAYTNGSQQALDNLGIEKDAGLRNRIGGLLAGASLLTGGAGDGLHPDARVMGAVRGAAAPIVAAGSGLEGALNGARQATPPAWMGDRFPQLNRAVAGIGGAAVGGARGTVNGLGRMLR